MFWLLRAAKKLRERGILGMNRRNAAYILDHNPRRLYPLVDDKMRMRDLCVRIGVPTPEIYGEIKCYAELRRFQDFLGKGDDFVVKPSNGSAGRGVLVIMGRTSEGYVRHSGEILPPDQLRQHLSAILSGMYSLGGRPDRALIQQRVRCTPPSSRSLTREFRICASFSIATNRRWRCCVCRPKLPMAEPIYIRAV